MPPSRPCCLVAVCRRARYAVGGGGGGLGGLGGGGLGGLGGNLARKVKRVLVVLMSAFSTPIRIASKIKPRLPKWTGLELDRVRPLKSSVSPSAPTRNVAYGSAPLPDRNLLAMSRASGDDYQSSCEDKAPAFG